MPRKLSSCICAPPTVDDVWAMCSLGSRYERGIGVLKNEVRAPDLYRRSARWKLVGAVNVFGTYLEYSAGTDVAHCEPLCPF
jgi:hypothetical protein